MINLRLNNLNGYQFGNLQDVVAGEILLFVNYSLFVKWDYNRHRTIFWCCRQDEKSTHLRLQNIAMNKHQVLNGDSSVPAFQINEIATHQPSSPLVIRRDRKGSLSSKQKRLSAFLLPKKRHTSLTESDLESGKTSNISLWKPNSDVGVSQSLISILIFFQPSNTYDISIKHIYINKQDKHKFELKEKARACWT